MKIGKRVRKQIITEFESALNRIKRLEPVKYYIQEEMAINAADAAISYLEWCYEQEKKP